jgi:hypothetical protein
VNIQAVPVLETLRLRTCIGTVRWHVRRSMFLSLTNSSGFCCCSGISFLFVLIQNFSLFFRYFFVCYSEISGRGGVVVPTSDDRPPVV